MGMAESSDNTSRVGHWQTIAARWSAVGSPLRPHADDLGFVEREASGWAARHGRPPRVLILGVTPELCRLAWPTGTTVHAADRYTDMIRAVWPGSPAQVVCLDWRQLGRVHAAGSIDLIVCDGGWHLLPWPNAQSELATCIAGLLAPGGLALVRLFALPEVRETPEVVLADLVAGRISDMNRLKLRLGMALQRTPEEGVRLGDVWDCVAAVAPDLAVLADCLGWPREQAEALVSYRGSDDRYHFISQVVATRCLESTGNLRCVRAHLPGYPMGAQFPTIVVERL